MSFEQIVKQVMEQFGWDRMTAENHARQRLELIARDEANLRGIVAGIVQRHAKEG